MQSGGNGQGPESLSRIEKGLSSKYGKLLRGGLIGPKHKERTYFDSGDFALSAADRVTDNGAIQTGKAHPNRDSVSHPYAPIPAASNVDNDANEDSFRRSASLERSPLLQETNIKGEEPTKNEVQDNPTSREF
ncbi:uncharacterized protein N7482_006252 [Penicillium canariense]|uniref:mRNA stability protein n=1 Tax=Penicillium canariense TaxID=189055 RepID=A0A9W9LNS7_9EURO|nr:uncharacterized protein N7482_006252 [Penicillium canariense]KAJ5167471.1 hypothetical protein N7482_006252 [Penicillium canariense]